MGVTAGGILEFKAPGSGETARIPVLLLDSLGEPVAGEAFDAPGMIVEYAKEGDSSFTAFPFFAAANWDEIGHGLYVVIIDGNEVDETALLDTTGHFFLYVGSDAARGDIFTIKINSVDVIRNVEADMNAISDAFLKRALSSVEDTAEAGTVAAALAVLGHKILITGSVLRVYKADGVTPWFDAPLTKDETAQPVIGVDPT